MKDPVGKLIELTGTSTTSIEDAVAKAIKRAYKTVKNLWTVSTSSPTSSIACRR